MVPARIVWLTVSLAIPQAGTAVAPQNPCVQMAAGAMTDRGVSQICVGDDFVRLANAAGKTDAERVRLLEQAADSYREAESVAGRDQTKAFALNVLVGVYDSEHLNDPLKAEAALRQLIVLTPDDLAPMFRLAKLQEDQGLFDGAEVTLLDARRRQPLSSEPYKMLTQFFARRVTALRKEEAQKDSHSGTASPGEPDAAGVYRVGGAITAPMRDGVPRYPPEAQAAGVKGVVVAEVVVDPSGAIVDARVVQSVPLLDEAALQAVRSWHYAPTVINGQAVPVRMNVTVNFSLPPPPAPPAPPR